MSVQSSAPPPGELHVDPGSARVARELKHSARRVVGLLPASNAVPVEPVAVELGFALARIAPATVVLIDPDLRWRRGVSGGTHAFFGTGFLDRTLMLMAPHEKAPRGAKADLLRLMIHEVCRVPGAFAQILVDLAGFDRVGEFLAALDALDGVLVLGRAGVTRERELLEANRRLPRSLDLGVLLTE